MPLAHLVESGFQVLPRIKGQRAAKNSPKECSAKSESTSKLLAFLLFFCWFVKIDVFCINVCVVRMIPSRRHPDLFLWSRMCSSMHVLRYVHFSLLMRHLLQRTQPGEGRSAGPPLAVKFLVRLAGAKGEAKGSDTRRKRKYINRNRKGKEQRKELSERSKHV